MYTCCTPWVHRAQWPLPHTAVPHGVPVVHAQATLARTTSSDIDSLRTTTWCTDNVVHRRGTTPPYTNARAVVQDSSHRPYTCCTLCHSGHNCPFRTEQYIYMRIKQGIYRIGPCSLVLSLVASSVILARYAHCWTSVLNCPWCTARDRTPFVLYAGLYWFSRYWQLWTTVVHRCEGYGVPEQ